LPQRFLLGSLGKRRSYVSSTHEETQGERSAVYVTMNRVKTADEPIENAAIVGEGIEDWLRDVDGFEGMLILSREGTSIGLTFWESREVADRYRPLRMQFLEKVLSTVGVELEESLDFEVTFAKLGPRLAGGVTA
jgi:hypothetical protein